MSVYYNKFQGIIISVNKKPNFLASRLAMSSNPISAYVMYTTTHVSYTAIKLTLNFGQESEAPYWWNVYAVFNNALKASEFNMIHCTQWSNIVQSSTKQTSAIVHQIQIHLEELSMLHIYLHVHEHFYIHKCHPVWICSIRFSYCIFVLLYK